VADARLKPLEVPVSQGQFIALSGNTGHSTGPHLHLELHDTRTWDMLDPYEVLADFLNDTVPPRAHAVEAVPQSGAVFNVTSRSSTFSLQAPNLTAWGRVGFALWGNDYMQGTYNHYGIRYTTLLVDGREVFRSDVGRVPVFLNRMVNVWGDYQHYRHSNVWYMKSFLEPGCRLPILWADENRGIINFCEERDYQLEYVLRDYQGNESRYRFTVRGVNPGDRVVDSGKNHKPLPLMLRYDRTSSFSRPGMQLVVPQGLLPYDVVLQPTVQQRPGALSAAYSFTASSLPLLSDAELSISLRHADSNPTKYFLTNEQGRYLGGDYHDGWVTGRIRELAGLYQLAYDDQPPVVEQVSAGQRLVLRVTDVGSGLSSWTAEVDGRFIVFDAVEKSSHYVCDLRETWLSPSGRQHHLRFTATDNRQNDFVYETDFTY
jgi:Peptidase family M23.